jgi:hypothetical protein
MRGAVLSQPAGPAPPAGATVEPSGFATILSAPHVPYPTEPPAPPGEQETQRLARERGISVSHAELMMNPDEPTRHAAMALERRLRRSARDNYIDVRIVRDPRPRFQFHFRRDAAATLARFTRDPRFLAAEGGRPRSELQPILDSWMQRLGAYRLASSGGTDPFTGTIELDVGVSRPEFEAIAAREGWQLPPEIRLNFAPEIDPASLVPPAAAPFLRTFARADRAPGATLDIANRGRVILVDGCFRLNTPDGPHALFGRNTRLVLDQQGYLAVQSVDNRDLGGRIGEEMIWGGYPGAREDEPGVQAIRQHCGSGPIESVGQPYSAAYFRLRPYMIAEYARANGLSPRAAWDRIKACWAEQDAQREASRPGERPAMPMRECDSIHPINPPPPRRAVTGG